MNNQGKAGLSAIVVGPLCAIAVALGGSFGYFHRTLGMSPLEAWKNAGVMFGIGAAAIAALVGCCVGTFVVVESCLDCADQRAKKS